MSKHSEHPRFWPHFWQGEWIDDATLAARIADLPALIQPVLGKRLEIESVFRAADAYSRQIKEKSGNYEELIACLRQAEIEQPNCALLEMAGFLSRPSLELKVRRELGSIRPFLPLRTQYADAVFEAWAPLGLLVHVTPSNAATAAPLSVIEGLLSGNLNFLKTSSSENLFPMLFLEGFLECDLTRELKDFIIAAKISSREKNLLKALFKNSDAIAAWGGERAMASIREMAPASTRVVEWGHKISFVYATQAGLAGTRPSSGAYDPLVLEKIAQECLSFEQQACSSPQCVYVDGVKDHQELENLGQALAQAFKEVSASRHRSAPSLEESGEITLVTELARQESVLGLGKVFEPLARDWRILVDHRPGLAASPLYGSVWLKALNSDQIHEILRPMRSYLQTVGLACGLSEAASLSEKLTQAGALRIRRVGEMLGSYAGEAHDGVYALQRYAKRISIQLGAEAARISSFAELNEEASPFGNRKIPIMTKLDFQETPVDGHFAELYFKSGGSSGEPKLSVFTYDDYDEQMRIGAEGLFAAGLDPTLDRNMNLFFSGGLYGGFLSIFSVLERMKAIQFPMAAQLDFKMVADTIIKNRVNSLLGMPSYVVQLFEKEGDALLSYGGIDKIFYGGEHFNDAQRRHLREKFGITQIKSVGYGSVDAGPLGYQCVHCEGGVHHVYQKLQYLEIVRLDKDEPVEVREIGRLIFTSKMRRGQKLDRYDLGDVGQWIAGRCPCGSLSPRFKLMGRSGDVFRVGSIFLNYQKFIQLLSEVMNYAGVIQIRISLSGLREKVSVCLSHQDGVTTDSVRRVLLANYDDLNEVVTVEKILDLEILAVNQDELERTRGSGKLVRIIDYRDHPEGDPKTSQKTRGTKI